MEKPYYLAIDKTSAIVSSVPEQGGYLKGGGSYLSLIFTPVPRLLRENRPSFKIWPWVAENLYYRENRSCVPPGLIGGFHLNFS